MNVITVTITSTNKPQPVIDPASTFRNRKFNGLYIQYNGANTNTYVGDQTVSSSNGILLVKNVIFPLTQFKQISDVGDFWVQGTSGDQVVFMVLA